MAPSVSMADTGIKFVDIVGKVANIALRVDSGAVAVADFLGPVAGFIPYFSQAVAVLKIAQPILSKIASAAPAVSAGIDAGRPIIEAMQSSGPAVMQHVKEMLAVVMNHDPTMTHGGKPLTADDISDSQVLAFAGPVFLGRQWTAEETQRWYDKAQGTPQ